MGRRSRRPSLPRFSLPAGLPRRLALGGLAVAGALALGGIGLALALRNGGPEAADGKRRDQAATEARTSPGPSPSPPPSPSRPTESLINRAGGYRFSYPKGWRVRKKGTATRLISPDRDMLVAFGHAPSGELRRASRRFVGSIRDSYRRVRIARRQRTLVGRRPAVVVAGRATNERDVPVRFLAITVEGRRRNYGISVFTAKDADPSQTLPPLQQIVTSFRPLKR